MKPDDLDPNAREFYEERAAIREHDGNQPRAEAERNALSDVEQWLRETKGQGR